MTAGVAVIFVPLLYHCDTTVMLLWWRCDRYDVDENFYNPNLPEYASCSKLDGNFCQNWGGECANGTLLQPQSQRRYGFHCGTCDLNFFLNMTTINPANINEVRSRQLYVMWGFNNAGNHNRNMYSSPSIAQHVCQPCPVGTGSPHHNVSSLYGSSSSPSPPRCGFLL